MGQRIVQVDAFTDRIFHGNPAAICVLDARRRGAGRGCSRRGASWRAGGDGVQGEPGRPVMDPH